MVNPRPATPLPTSPTSPPATSAPALRAAAADAVTRIEPSRGWVQLRLRELWGARQLLYFLVWRDVKVRYKQAALGAAWAIIQPLMTMVVFTLFFGRLGGVKTGDIPYPLFVLSALLPWQLFSFSLTESSTSLVTNKALITKVYFPRLVIPIASVGAGLVDFAISFGVLIALMLYFHVPPSARLLTLPLWVLFAALTALAVGLWLSALNVKYRDVRYVIPFLNQFWLFSTPIAYSIDVVPPAWRGLYGLNPMVGVVQGFRWAILGGPRLFDASMLASLLVVIVLLGGGAAYFRRTEKTFADLV